jgi:hypothetical protein
MYCAMMACRVACLSQLVEGSWCCREESSEEDAGVDLLAQMEGFARQPKPTKPKGSSSAAVGQVVAKGKANSRKSQQAANMPPPLSGGGGAGGGAGARRTVFDKTITTSTNAAVVQGSVRNTSS